MEATVTEAQRAAPPPRMRELYATRSRRQLTSRFGYANPMQVPRLEKVTLNMGVGEAKHTTSVLEAATEQLAVIAGQRPNVRSARKSIANFKVREGMPVGVSVTLRGARMWEFVDRLVSIAIPRIRDFRGLNPRSFDGRGNYSLGRPRAADLPRDRLRLDRPGPRPRRDHHDERAQTDEEAFELLLGARLPVRRRRGGPAQADTRTRGGGAPARGGPPARRGRAGGPRAAQGGEPRGLRQAGAPRGGRGRRGGCEGEPTPRATKQPKRKMTPSEERNRPRNHMAKTSQSSSTAAQAEVQDPGLQPLPPLRAAARLLPQVRPLPAVPARARPQGIHPRDDQVELVTEPTTMTDAHRPISDYLTRVRNAITAQHADVEIPSSRLKKEMSRILYEQGYINGFAVEPDPGRRRDPDPAQVRRGAAGDHRPAPDLAARPAALRRARGDPAGSGRHGHRDPVHVGGRDDRPRGGSRRASAAKSSPTCGDWGELSR